MFRTGRCCTAAPPRAGQGLRRPRRWHWHRRRGSLAARTQQRASACHRRSSQSKQTSGRCRRKVLCTPLDCTGCWPSGLCLHTLTVQRSTVAQSTVLDCAQLETPLHGRLETPYCAQLDCAARCHRKHLIMHLFHDHMCILASQSGYRCHGTGMGHTQIHGSFFFVQTRRSPVLRAPATACATL